MLEGVAVLSWGGRGLVSVTDSCVEASTEQGHVAAVRDRDDTGSPGAAAGGSRPVSRDTQEDTMEAPTGPATPDGAEGRTNEALAADLVSLRNGLNTPEIVGRALANFVLPWRRHRSRWTIHHHPRPCREVWAHDRRRLRAVGRWGRRGHWAQEGSGPRRRERTPVRRGHRQRTQDLVPGRCAPSRDLGRAGRRPGQRRRRRRDRGLGRPARHYPSWAAWAAGSGIGREDRGRGDPALHVPGR